jgi:siroheme synthase-like protein
MSFPLVLDLRGRVCLVVGSLDEAAQRVARFLQAGAKVRWFVTNGFSNAPEASTVAVERLERPWTPADLDDAWLVVLTDRDSEQASRLRAACDERRLYFCAVDQPAFNTFNHVAVVEQGPVQIAISTGGKVPALARRLRVVLERCLGDGRFAAFAQHLAELRDSSPVEHRKRVLEDALEGFDLEARLILPEDPKRPKAR